MNKGRLYAFLWLVLRPYYDLVFPRRVQGLENLPATGGFVLCINHISARDPLFLATRIPRRRRIFFLAKKELFDMKFVGFFVRALGGIPIDRGNADLNAVRTSLQVLREGHGLGIFPQGTRSPDNSPTPMLNGASMIALRGGVPVIPAFIDGPYRAFHRVNIYFGPAVDLSDFGKKCDHDTLAAATGRIEAGVWNLRPKKEAKKDGAE